MINKKTKSVGIVLLSILMLFSFMLFTACQPLDPADPPSNPPKVYTNADVKTILNKANIILKQTPAPITASVDVKTTGMTEYNGIDSWILNSVDFQENKADAQNEALHTAMPYVKIFSHLLNNDLIDINENYIPTKDISSDNMARIKIQISNNKLELYSCDSNGEAVSILGFLITFNDDLDVQNMVIQMAQSGNYKVVDCKYWANSSYYECLHFYTTENEMSALHKEVYEEMLLEFNKPVQQIETIELNFAEIRA